MSYLHAHESTHYIIILLDEALIFRSLNLEVPRQETQTRLWSPSEQSFSLYRLHRRSWAAHKQSRS